MAESAQKTIGRKDGGPRVQIEYDVNINGAQKKESLPFVMGVLADLYGNAEREKPAVKDRPFTDVDAYSFDDFLRETKPQVKLEGVKDKLNKKEGKVRTIYLTFESMDDFLPLNIARKVKGLDKLLEARTQLAQLLNKIDGTDSAEKAIETAMAEMLKKMPSLKSTDDVTTETTGE
jgi:type VI secretion system protein ImpB